MPANIGLRISSLVRLRKHSADAAIAILFVAATIAWSAYSGKDLNWDQLNYHFYVAFSFLNDRISQDFMAANGQSYLNPLGYVPFYLMVVHGWHSLLVASVLAAFHALNIVLAYFIVKAVLMTRVGDHKLIATLGAALAFLSPVFLMEAGTTFIDVTTAFFVLAGVLAVLRAEIHQRWWSSPLLYAGLCFGAASALKLSNLVFAPAFAVMLIWMNPGLRRSIRALLLFGAGGLAGVVAAHAQWSWQLVNAFGDPDAPTIQALRGSPDIPPSTASLPQRFLPESLLDAVLVPFRMMEVRSWVYIETAAPDLRFAAVILLLIVAAACALRMSNAGNTAEPARRRRAGLFVFFLSAVVLWIATSSNGRYGIVVSILCGPVIAAAASSVWRRQLIVAGVLATLIAAQVLHLQHLSPRWTGEEWTESWYEAQIPERLAREPYLYISVSGNSGSYIAPYLHPDSAFTNPIGQVSFDFDDSGGKRLRALFDRHRGRTRALAPIGVPDDENAIARWMRNTDSSIARLGFAVDPGDCLTITTAGPPWQLLGDAESGEKRHFNHMRTCALRERAYEHAAERSGMTRIVRQIESWCPRLFRTNHGVVEGNPGGWKVSYASTDTVLAIRSDRIILTQPRSAAEVHLGTIDQWERGVRPGCENIPTRFRLVYTFD